MQPKSIFRTLVASVLMATGFAQAYENEVWAVSTTYHWKINNVEQGTTTDLSTAIANCIWQSSGAGREIHVLTGGDLSGTVNLPGGVQLFGHNNTFNITHTGIAVYAKGVSDIGVHDMTINNTQNYVFRITTCNNVNLSGMQVSGGWIGMRVDSRDSQPWLATSYNLTITDCLFENLSSHGIETYGIDGVYVDGIVARNNGECGVLFNNSRNGYVGSVDAYRCSYGSGYAGLRFANDNANFRVKYLKAVECGRGFFTTTGATNITVEEAYIRDCSGHNVLIQYADRVGINSGSFNGGALIHYTSKNSWVLAADVGGVTETPPTTAPAGLEANVSNSGIALSYSAVSGATNYRLQRSTAINGPFMTVAYLENTTYTDRNISAGTTYYYRVRAHNAAGVGPSSSSITAAVPGSYTPAVDLAAGLKKHFLFNGSTADNQGGASATVTGTTTYVSGVQNQALSFDGNSYATVGPLTGADYRDFTAAAWVKPSSSADWQRFFDFGENTDNYFTVSMSGSSIIYETRQNGVPQSVISAAKLPMNQWSHFAVTFVGNSATLYINGQRLESVMFSHNPIHLDLANNELGKSKWANPLYSGLMDDFRLYDRGLSDAEISALVLNAPPVAPADLLASDFGPKVRLTWSSPNSVTYNVKRATSSGGPYTTIATGVTASEYWDTSVPANGVFYYVVSGTNPQGEGGNSNEKVVNTDSLTARLKFNESSGSVAADSSGNGWNASLYNTPTWVAGAYGNAVNLASSSSQHGILPTGVVSGLNDFTICTWVKVTSFIDWVRLFDIGTGTDNYMFLCPQPGGAPGLMRFAIRTPSTGEQVINSSTPLTTGTWAHIAITLNGTTGSMYLNGALVGTNSNMTLKPSDLGKTNLNYLGRSQWPDPYFDGAINDFQIYAKALTQQEIDTVRNGGDVTPPAAPSSLVPSPGDGRVDLDWADNSESDLASYTVYRSTTSGSGYSAVATGLTASVYSDTSAINGTTYYYVVTASDKWSNVSPNSSQVTATPQAAPGPLPPVWSSGDVGSVAATGSAGYLNGVYTVSGSGADIWDTADEFQFVYQQINGDCDIRVQVLSLDYTNAWAKAGVIIRQSLSANSAHAMSVITPGSGVSFQRRATAGAISEHTTLGGTTAPEWVRLVRAGNMFTAYHSADGSTWTTIGSQSITMSTTVFVGLAVTSHYDGVLAKATFDNVSVAALPSPWNSADIGAVSASGNVAQIDGTFTIDGSGTDIWGTSDQFRFVYQTASGDCEVVARVTSVENTDIWAKAGVMIRETTAASSRHAMMAVTSGSGVSFQRRASTGGTSSHTTQAGLAAPYWIRIVRSGNTFTGYRSTNGTSWTNMGSETISMSTNVEIGLAVTSHNNGTLCTATLDNVIATP